MRTATTLGTVLIFFVACHVPALAGSCEGNACDDVLFELKDGCFHTTNVGKKNVRVTRDTASFTLQPGESHVLMAGKKKCLKGYVGKDKAYYEVQGIASNAACKKIQKLAELGWKKEHKTRFCQARGFDDATNFPKSGYRDHGGGFCYSGDEKTCLELMKGQ